MTVRSDRLAIGETGAANVAVTAFTVPAGETWIVKSIYIAKGTASTGVVNFQWKNGAIFENFWVLNPSTAGPARLDPCWLIFTEFDELRFLAVTVANVVYFVNGAKLVGLAP